MTSQFFVHRDFPTGQSERFYASQEEAVQAIQQDLRRLQMPGQNSVIEFPRKNWKTFQLGEGTSDLPLFLWSLQTIKVSKTTPYLLHTWNDTHRHMFEWFKTEEEASEAQFFKPNGLHSELLDSRTFPHSPGTKSTSKEKATTKPHHKTNPQPPTASSATGS